MTVAVLVTLVFGIFPGPLLDLAGSAVPSLEVGGF
jgi:hypothetical protein